jgi:hypothetical protein
MRSVCREVASGSLPRQGERVRSSDNSYKIAAGEPSIPETRGHVLGTRAGRKIGERSTFKNDRENEPDMTTYPLEFHRRSEQKWMLRAQAAGKSTPPAARLGSSQRGQRTANGARNDRLARSRAACAVPTAPVVSVPRFAADKSFVHLDNASEFFKVPVSERRSDTVAHVPSGFVRTEAHEAMNLKRAHSLFAGQHQVNNAEPIFERLIRVLENCARNVRETIAGLRRAFVALPVPRIALQFCDTLSATARASNALRPSLADQIGAASLFVREMSVELGGGKLVNRLAGSHWSSPPVVGRNVPWPN